MDWTEIAYPTGTPASGSLGMRLVFRLPDRASDEPATDRQADAVLMFYEQSFGDLSHDQASALLACRDFSLAGIRAARPRYPQPLQFIFARAIAAFLQSDSDLLAFVEKWSEAAYRRGSGSPRVKGSPIFTEVETFVGYLEGMMELDGWTADHLSGFR